MGILRKRNGSAATPGFNLVEVPVGFDRTAASIIVARCEAEEIPIQLLTMEENGLAPGIASVQSTAC